jgi:hypothetical protein
MAFKAIQPSSIVPDSPEKLFLDLPRRKIPGVLPHQQEIMRTYASLSPDEPDVALQLPTGSGKTLVGLLIAEWRRRKFNEKVVYLAPTKQLVNQVVEQAEEKYGLTVHGFVGSNKDYDPKARANYKSGASIAVTTYSSLFNSSPFFDDADVIILDDVHTAENYISALWSVRIERTKLEHSTLHTALCVCLKPLLEPFHYSRLVGDAGSITDNTWVDKLPTPEYARIVNQLVEIMDVHTKGTELSYSWKMIRDHIQSCHLYFSAQEILIRPLIPPTWTHKAFTDPKQRIYMSATLGEGGDLERLVGRAPIKRLPVSEGWDSHGVGRRFFIFPEMSLSAKDSKELRLELMKQTERSLVLVPNTKLCDEIAKDVRDILGYKVFSAEDIEGTKSLFTTAKTATAVVANRYDGIDFPGDECRLLFIEGLPRATNIQERFLMSRMGANALFNERIQTRVLQAIGRCTRSLEDYSAVVVTGEELPDYLADNHRRKYFHPELQAELKFGVEQSKGMDAKGIIENLKIFLENGQDWEKVSQQIMTFRKVMTKQPFPAMSELQDAVVEEISYQKKLWQKDYEKALASADAVLSIIKDPELRGYRALWHYLAGSAAWLALNAGGSKTFEARAQQEFSRAKEAATGITWLVPLARYSEKPNDKKEVDESIISEQVEHLESVLASLGATYERNYALREKEIIDGLASKDTTKFEHAHKLLGTMLGFESDNKETDGAPDPWWISANICLVFEDHSGASDGTAIDVSKARQAASHPAWMRANVASAVKAEILPVLITPATTIKESAVSHLGDVSLWNLSEFQKWSKDALTVIRGLRTTFTEPGNLVWRAETMTILKQKEFDAVSLIKKLRKNKAKDILKPVR